MKHTKQLFLLLLLAIVSNVAAWGQKTYKLEQVTEVQGAAMYVFEQGGYVMNNTVSSNALQTTNSYLTTGLTGSESYVWKLETNGTGYKMRNMSLNAANAYLRNSSSTNVSFGNVSADNNTWIFSFAEGTVLIQNKDNGNRFLGYTSSTSYAYKAYATSNLSSYPHSIKVYKLVEETAAYIIEAISNDNSYGTVSISGNTITATPATGYQVSTTNPYTVTSGTATVEQDGNTFAVTPSENCTVQINFEAIPNETNLYIKANSAPYVYTWTGEGSSKTEHMGSWPGTQTTETEDVNGITWHKITVTAKGFNLILNTGNNGTQTSDINNITEDKYIVWNADGLSASQYLFVDDYATVTASDVTVGEGRTANSNITSTPDGLTFSYSSDNTSVATVANDGTITGVAQGSATITVSWNALEVNGLGYPGGSTTFTVNVTEAETERTYVKVTSTDDIEDGKKYLIVYEDGNLAFDGSLSTLDAASNNQEVVINNGTIKTDANIYFTISGGTILSASGKYIGKDASGNGLDVSSSSLINEISISDGNVIIKGLGGSYLKFNDASNQNRFRYYGSGQKAIQLYKEESVTQEVNIYVKSDSAPYVYTWTGEGSSKTEHMGSWPGTQTTDTEVKNGITWHKITVHAKGFNLILSKKEGETQIQTSDINNITEDKFIVWNSAADGYAANQYLFVDFATVSAQGISVRAGKTVASNVTTTPEGLNLTYQSGDTSKATVDSNGNITGVAEGSAKITVSWATQEISDHHGYLAGSTTFTVTVTPASTSSDVFVKATSKSDLQDGMQVIIVNDDYENVMGEQKDNNFGVATVEIDKNASPYEATPGEHATILTLEGSTDAWYFKDEHGNYLYAASNSKNYLKTQSDKTDNAKATITISGDNSDAAIVFQGDHKHNIIMYNGTEQGSGIFSCYTSGQKPVQIYYRASQTIVARPTIDPANGTTYTEAKTVTITNNAEGATVYYTTDGSTPTAESTQYTAPFVLRQNGTHTIKAIAISNDSKSSVATSTITINIEIAAPVIDPASGTQITEATSISITAEGLTIYYTTDGSDPVKDGALTGTAKAYTGEFTLTKAGTVKAVARDAGGNFSEIVSATYTYNGTVTAPYYENFDEGLGNFTVEQTGTVPPKWIFQTTTNEATYGTRKYAFVNGSNKQGTTRLVSPVIDLTDETIQNVTLSFVHAGRYFDGYNAPSYTSEQTAAGNAPTHAQVFVREENGTWQQVTIPNWFTQAGSNDPNIYERINSGEIPLDDYKGKKVQVSFLYTADGSNEGSNSTGIWNVLKFALTTTEAEVENYEIVEMKTDGFVTYVVQNDIDVAKTLENNTKEEGANVHVYKVTEFSKTDAVFGEFGYGDNETVIPAETPVIIKGTRGVNKLVIAKGGDIIAKPANNLLLPSYGDVAPTDEQHLLVFQKTSDWNEAEPYSNYAFFKLKTGRTIPNRKAYLNGTDFKESITTQTNPAKGVFLMEDLDMDYEIPLGVETVNTTNRAQNTGIFDLMGRKVADKAENVSAAVLQKGVYIVNGRKVVIK